MGWAEKRAALLGESPPLSLDDVIAALRERDSGLYVEDGQLRYLGPDLAHDDPLAAGIEQHRAMLTELFTYAPGGRCVFDCFRLLAPGDPIACPDHRMKLDEQGA